jgi:hypothetical protein
MTLLTNSEGGPALTSALFDDDWALRRFAGLSNLPAKPRRLSRAALAAYEGSYVSEDIGVGGQLGHRVIELRAHNGRLRGVRKAGGQVHAFALTFYRPDYVLDLDEQGRPTGARSDFLRGADRKVAWFRTHGRLWRRRG